MPNPAVRVGRLVVSFAVGALAVIQLVNWVVAALSSDLTATVQFYPYHQYPDAHPVLDERGRVVASVWVADVRNEGKRAVNAVRLSLPWTNKAAVFRPGAPPRDTTIDDAAGVILLGPLQPKEHMTVVAWSPVDLGTFETEGLSLTHDNGVGSVTVRRPVGRIGQFVDTWGIAVVVLFAIPLLSFGLFTAAWRLGQEQGKREVEKARQERGASSASSPSSQRATD